MPFYGPVRRLLPAALLALAVLPAHALRTESFFSSSGAGAGKLEVASGSSMVRFRTGVSSAAASAALEGAGFQVRGYIGGTGWAEVGLPEGMSVSQGLSLLSSLGAVEAAAPNRIFRPNRVPDDPFVGSQYALSRIEAFGAWEYETGSSSRATVAIIDTGIDASHPELSGKLSGTSRAFNPTNGAASNNQPPTAACNHATRAAGVAAAASGNALGVAGVSWGARLISLKVFDTADCYSDCGDKPGHACGTSEVSIAAAINDVRSLHNGAQLGKVIVNMSLGSIGGCSVALQTAVTNAVNDGLLLFAAAGNDSATLMDSPSNCTGVVAVGATDSADNLASFSNTDTRLMTAGITAPGVEIYTTDISSSYVPASGTSFSSPMSAGLAALLWSAKPAASAADIKGYMMDSADDLGAPGPDREYGRGRINALKAIRLALGVTKDY
ncbi:MAG TPA: hypothetical protein DCZ92_11410, partial [Elusimicrobia bacterium]|nr:hypothetical protein [Elusimicrobiota bacterium]